MDQLADLGAYFSLGQRSLTASDIIRTIPYDRLLFESDANRTNRLTPDAVIRVYRSAAEILGKPLPSIVDQVAANFARLFGQ